MARDGMPEVKGNPARKAPKSAKITKLPSNPPVPTASLAKIVQCIKKIYFAKIRPQLGSHVNFGVAELPK
jgi:hypothetical protein